MEPYELGGLAYHDGKAKTDCPYVADSDDWYEWCDGWQDQYCVAENNGQICTYLL